MKIRTDFVTNSSSSSFIMIKFTSKKMTELVNKYPELIQDKESDWYVPSLFYVNDDEHSITFSQEECWLDLYMEEDNIECMIDSIINAFDNYCFEDEIDEDIRDFFNDIRENKEEILEDIEELYIEESNSGWQGDDESRFWQDWYTPEHLECVLETIAEENGCTVEEVDGEMFSEYVCDKTSEETNTTMYSKTTGKITRDRTTDLI